MSSKKVNKNKNYTNVVDMARDVFGDRDPSFADELQSQIDSCQLISLLSTMRNQKGVTQADVAEILGCKQAKISKLENGVDDDICIEEIRAYAKAVDCEVTLQFTKRNETAFDRIKRHTFLIHGELSLLASLAQKDEKIAKGVAESFGEYLKSQIKLLRTAVEKLPNDPETDEPYIKISLETNVEDFMKKETLASLSETDTVTA